LYFTAGGPMVAARRRGGYLLAEKQPSCRIGEGSPESLARFLADGALLRSRRKG